MNSSNFKSVLKEIGLMFITLGIYEPTFVLEKQNFEQGSLKHRIKKITNIFWAIFFFTFLSSLFLAMTDKLFFNRAIVIKYLTRIGLISALATLILDFVVSFIKGSDKRK